MHRPTLNPPPPTNTQTGVALLMGERLCSEVLYKEEYVPPFELQCEFCGVGWGGVGVGWGALHGAGCMGTR